MKNWNRNFPLTAAALLLAVQLAGCGQARTDAAEGALASQPKPVKVRRPKRMAAPLAVNASGTVEARTSVELAFRVSGRVQRVLVEEGMAVRAGQLVAEIDPGDYQLALEAAQARQAAAQAQLEKALSGSRRQELEQARIALKQAEDEYRRMKRLFDRGSLAANDFQKFEAAWQAARTRHELAVEGARREDIRAAQAELQLAKAQRETAARQVADTRLIAPISGIVARRAIDQGEMAAAGQPVISIVDLSQVNVHVAVPEADVAAVKPGQRAEVRVPALGERCFPGQVELVGVAADPASRTYTARIVLPNPDLLLRAGMIADAEISSGRLVEVLTLPGEAIVRDPQGATLVYVYYPDKGRVYGRRVEAGRVRGDEVEIESGLQGGELVVIAGQHQISEGAAVVKQ